MSWAWRAPLVASGVLLVAGGSMHPDAPADEGLREEFAIMMSDSAWVPGHALIVVSTVLLAVGLTQVRKLGAWPREAHRAVTIAATAVGLYVVETVFHTLSFVDVDRLRAGEFAPVAFTHLGLATVLYPVSGLALAYLAWSLLPTWTLPQRALAGGGVVGGIMHALSVPLTIALPDTELSFLFAGAATLLAVWSIAAGLIGLRAHSDAATQLASSRRSAGGAVTHNVARTPQPAPNAEPAGRRLRGPWHRDRLKEPSR